LGTYTITGGAGFIGSHLADALLAGGHSVRVLDDFSTGRIDNLDPRCEVIRGDVCDPAVVRSSMLGVSGCFHLAAIASVARANENWIGTHQVNLGGMINVLDASRHLAGIPVVYASSAAVYGRVTGVADEQTSAAPMTAYGADKRGCELHAQAGALVHGVPSLGFRFFNVYGPRQDPHSPYSGVISIFSKAIASGQPIQIHGDGQQTRDFIYVGDIVAFLLAGMEFLKRGQADDPAITGLVLNACTGRETSINQLVGTLGGLIASQPKVSHGPSRPGDILRSVGSPTRAAGLLGIEARTELSAGLATTLQGLQNTAHMQVA